MTQIDRIDLKYQLKFKSAFHCGSGLTNGLINRAVVRDTDGYLYIPGSTIKGILRESCERIAKVFGLPVRDPHNEQQAMNTFFDAPDIVECIFGSRFKEGSLFFDNTWIETEAKHFFDSSQIEQKYLFMQTENRTQTRISRLTNTVLEGALYTSEFGISQLSFTGKIHGCLEGITCEMSDLPATYQLFLFLAGIYGAERIGANCSTGFGRCQFAIQEFLVNKQKQNAQVYCANIENLILYEDAGGKKNAD